MRRLRGVSSMCAACVLLALAAVPAAYGQPVVSTDRTDYFVGETVVVTGIGWESGETVVLTFREDPASHDPIVLNATADDAGRFTNMEFVIAAGDQGVRFTLAAEGQTSGYATQTYFTDPGKILVAWDPLLPGQVPNPAQPGGTAVYTVKLNVQTGTAFLVNLRVLSGLPAGATATFSPNPVSFSGSAAIGISTLTVTTSPSTPLGDHSITFRAEKTDTPATDYYDGIAVLSVRAAGLLVRTLIAPVGEPLGTYFGWSASSAGDLNRDGYTDVVVGDPGYSNWTGRAYVYFGGPAADATADLVLNPLEASWALGISTASAGDMNRDGYDDLIVGGHDYGPSGSGPGHACVYFGGPVPDDVPDLVLTGQLGRDQFGVSVASAGDVNGDGYGDVIVGALFGGGDRKGRAYVYYGGPIPNAVPDLIYAVSTSSFVGKSVAAVGDVNCDGYGDLAISGEKGNGRVFIHYGSPVPDTSPDVTLVYQSAGEWFGYTDIAGVGDVNGDGRSDMVVGASVSGGSRGRAYVYFGAPGFGATPNLVINGTESDSRLGFSVAGEDVNEDGHPDLVITQHGSDAGGVNAGQVHVYFGGPLLDAVPDLTITGEKPGDLFGTWIRPVRDFDGDGHPDLIVGAQGSTNEDGAAYVFSFAPPVGSVGGHVTATCPNPGTGVAGSAVHAYTGSPGGMLVKSTVTNNSGAYTLDALAIGSYWIRVVPPGGFSAPVSDVPVTVTEGGTVTVDFALLNAAPAVVITGPASGAIHAVGTPVVFTGEFTDDPGDVHSAAWRLEGTEVAGTVDETTGQVTGTYTFSNAGVYRTSLVLADPCGGADTATTVGGLDAMVVVYDPSAGFVTGGGWFDSPPGAYRPDQSLTGKASFGFVSKYMKGASTPSGETEFQFKAGSLNFHSTSYDWLVVAGARAQYKGVGTINGAGNYGFLLTAVDGAISGGGGSDRFRIKIVDRSDDALVYDSQLGAADDADPATVLGGGSIVIHKTGGQAAAAAPTREEPAPVPPASLPTVFALHGSRPNPFASTTTIGFDLPRPARVALTIHDVAGREVIRLVDRGCPAGQHRIEWGGRGGDGARVGAGVYLCRIVAVPADGGRTEIARRKLVMLP